MSKNSITAIRVKELRKSQKLTQEQLGKIVNLKKTSISDIENGKFVPGKEALTAMAQHFETTTDYILGNTDNRNDYTNDETFAEVERLYAKLEKMSAERKAKIMKMMDDIIEMNQD